MSGSKLTYWLQMPFQVILIVLILVYRYLVSPMLHMLAPGSGCRFQPSCSEYALQAVRIHGPLHGTWLAMKRISKCHPWGSHGYDPVPDGCSCTVSKDNQHPSSFKSPKLQGEHPILNKIDPHG